MTQSVTTQTMSGRSSVTNTATSLEVFRAAARTIPTDPRVIEHLAAVQGLIGDDLEWIESALSEACEEGVRPATHAARHLVERGGKRVRPMVALLAAACFGRVPPSARTLALVAELVHSATLLHDDVADEGTERRGARAARLLYGNAVSVLSGDLLLVHAIERTMVEATEALPDLLTTMRLLVDGEVIQLRGRTELDVSESTYNRVVFGKTASLFAWAARAGARSAGADPDQVTRLGEFGEQLGIAFQLVDDILDYEGASSGKTSLADLREGKMTLPLVVAVRAQPDLLHAVRRIHEGDLEPVAYLGKRVVASGACAMVREQAVRVTELAVSTLAPLPASRAKDLLIGLANELATRIS